MNATKTLSAVVGVVIVLVVVVMFLNRGNLSLGAGPKGVSLGAGY